MLCSCIVVCASGVVYVYYAVCGVWCKFGDVYSTPENAEDYTCSLSELKFETVHSSLVPTAVYLN